MAKPDKRADNVEKLVRDVQNTIENLHEADDYLSEHADEISDQETETILSRNERRKESIAGKRAEIKDEARNQAE